MTEIRTLTLDDLPRALVKARIARRLSIEQLAERLGWKARLLARYEETEYESATMRKVIEVADALDISVESVITLTEPKAAATEEVFDLDPQAV